MQLHIGTSGFAYKEWIGAFYPEGTREKAMLGWYAGQFDTVEINNTFYRFPTAAGLAAWAAQVPPPFQFAIKAPQRITHQKRLHGVGEEVTHLITVVRSLDARLGPLLFQFPPRMRPDPEALHALIALLPAGLRAAFEFRDLRWHCEEVYALLAERNCALCFDDAFTAEPHSTADWGYVRLRREDYTEAELEAAARMILAQPWREAFVFLKHEAPDSPLLARELLKIVSDPGREHLGTLD